MSNPVKPTIGKGDKEPIEGDSNEMPDPKHDNDSPPPSNGDQSPAQSDDDEPNPATPSKEFLSPSRQKRGSTSSTGEQSLLAVSPSKKSKQDAALVEQDDSASLDNNPSTSREKKPISTDDSTQKCPPSSECPSTPPSASQLPENLSTTPILNEMERLPKPLISPIRDEPTSQVSPDSTEGPGTPLAETVTTESLQPTSHASTQDQTLKRLLSTPSQYQSSENAPNLLKPSNEKPRDNPLLRRMLSGSKDSSSATQGVVVSNIPLPAGDQSNASDNSTDIMREGDYTAYASGGGILTQHKSLTDSSRSGAQQIEACKDVQVEEMADASKDVDGTTRMSKGISSHSSSPSNDPSAQSSGVGDSFADAFRTESDSSSQPISMDIPETSEVPQTIAGRLQKMSDNLEGIQLDVSSKVDTPGRKSRLQETKKSGKSKSALNAPGGHSAVNPDDSVFKKPEVTSRLLRPNTRAAGVDLEDSRATDSPNRRSDRIKSKESGASSKESASADKGRSLRPKSGSRTASDEKLKEGEKSKSVSRERVSKLKAESDALRSASVDRTKNKEGKTKPGTPSSKPKKTDSTPSGSRDRMSSEESVADRTRSRLASTSSNNSEADKAEEDEKEGATAKRKSRKDSAK